MSKKVIVLSASPRKGGNSDLLCDQFIAGAKAVGHDVQKVFVSDENIKYCNGCGVCYNGSKPCPQKDDMASILESMIRADVIVMATPVYFYTMNAQMKTLIDRTCARYTELSNKSFYFILTAADGNIHAMNRTVEGFRGFTSCLEGADEKGIVYGVGAWKVGDVKGHEAMNDAFKMGKNV